ncbi:hypothetical protein R1flu_013790 [Riccia fluitans]|uniref:YDG domain-containing protein n=1 Tax=Riccia fluitans TaxID=41844 RepID=A0ABD1YE92_9MARC
MSTARVVKFRGRIPSIRVKGPDLRPIVIPGRRGRKGEETRRIHTSEEWTDVEPPITVCYSSNSETNSDSDTSQRLPKMTKFKHGNDVPPDLEEDPQSDGSVQLWHTPTAVIESNVGQSNPSGSGESSSSSVREDFAPYRQTNEVAEDVIRMKKEAEERERCTVIIESDSSEDGFVPSKRFRSNNAENRLSMKTPRLKIIHPGTRRAASNSDLPNGGDSIINEEDLWGRDARTRVLEFKKMFHDRRKVEEEIFNRKRAEEKGTEVNRNRNRIDLKTYAYLEKTVMPMKGITSVYGKVPGIEVGDYFFYRVELMLVGLHRQIQSGIDYIPASARSRQAEFVDSFGKPLAVAVSVVSSQGGRYGDRHEGETLTYTGQGANNADQRLVRGNLALKNSYDLGVWVRVIRKVDVEKGEAPISFGGRPGTCSPSGILYIYDGFYKVEHYYEELQDEVGGFYVWKFMLKRVPGQKPIVDHLKCLA